MLATILCELINFIKDNFKDSALVLLSFFTVLFARKTYLAMNTPRIVVEKTTFRKSRPMAPEFECNIKNYGKGIAVKTFLILEYKKGILKKTSFKSKPEITISENEERIIRITFNEEENNIRMDQFTGFVVSQDFSGGYYYVKLRYKKRASNEHLKKFDKPVQPINKFLNPFKSCKVRRSMKRADTQRNTYVDLKEKEIQSQNDLWNSEEFKKALEQFDNNSQNKNEN